MSNSVVIPWTVALQAPLSMGVSRQEYWSGLPFPPPEDPPNPGIKPESPALAYRFFATEPPGNPFILITLLYIWGFPGDMVRICLPMQETQKMPV